MQQRGFGPTDIAFVLDHGTPTKDGYVLSSDDVERLCAEAHNVISSAGRLKGALVAIAGDTVKTVFRSSRRQQRLLLRRYR